MPNKFLKTFLATAFMASLFSCVNTKKLNVVWILKKQSIYEIIKDSQGKNIIIKDSITQPLLAKITRRDSILVVRVFEGNIIRDTVKTSIASAFEGTFFPYMDSAFSGSKRFLGSKKLVYLESSPILQALTIPLKVRFATGNRPYESEGSINFGVAAGWKFIHHVYRNWYHRKSGLYVSSDDNHYSITPGIFAGPGIVELNLQNSTTLQDRNVLCLTYGAMLVFGFNRLNIGVALGIDNAVGNNDKEWIYQGKPWLGATISFDLIQ